MVRGVPLDALVFVSRRRAAGVEEEKRLQLKPGA